MKQPGAIIDKFDEDQQLALVDLFGGMKVKIAGIINAVEQGTDEEKQAALTVLMDAVVESWASTRKIMKDRDIGRPKLDPFEVPTNTATWQKHAGT